MNRAYSLVNVGQILILSTCCIWKYSNGDTSHGLISIVEKKLTGEFFKGFENIHYNHTLRVIGYELRGASARARSPIQQYIWRHFLLFWGERPSALDLLNAVLVYK